MLLFGGSKVIQYLLRPLRLHLERYYYLALGGGVEVRLGVFGMMIWNWERNPNLLLPIRI